MSTALRLFGRLDILSNMPAAPARRAPCIHARLRPLVTKPYEISGLITRPCLYRNFRKLHLFQKVGHVHKLLQGNSAVRADYERRIFIKWG